MLDPVWRTSSRSQDTNCVEVASIDGEILMRDSKDRDGTVLSVTAREWDAFVAAVKEGEFDHE